MTQAQRVRICCVPVHRTQARGTSFIVPPATMTIRACSCAALSATFEAWNSADFGACRTPLDSRQCCGDCRIVKDVG